MSDKNELVVIEETTVLAAFSGNGGLDSIISQAREHVESFEHDLSTDAGRKRTASLANKVAKLKTRLDAMGKDLVSEWKAKSKAVDSNRKAMRDELDELKAIARKPLTEWEIEDKRIKEEEAARIEYEKIKAEIDAAHEIGLLMNDKFDRDLADRLATEEAARIESLRLAEEARIKREEEVRQQAILEAEEKAKKEAERMEREKQEAIIRAEQAERDRIAAIERAKIEAEQAELRRIESEKAAKLHAEQMAEKARLDEIKRQQDEAKRIQDEIDAREADKNHRRKVNKAALDALVKAGLTEDMAKAAITAICKNEVPNVKINY